MNLSVLLGKSQTDTMEIPLTATGKQIDCRPLVYTRFDAIQMHGTTHVMKKERNGPRPIWLPLGLASHSQKSALTIRRELIKICI